MRAKLTLAACAAVLICGTGLAIAREDAPPSSPQKGGYLAAGALDTSKILAPAPQPGDARYEADRKTFLATRALKDSPRWALAQADVDEKKILADFGCALGFAPTPETTPKLVALLTKLRFDVGAAVNKPKDLYKRQRPYLIDAGDICVPRTDSLAASPDYPSGHTTWGWTVGLILAEADPQDATQILIRARSFGESRVVCGVHNASAVEAGRTNASALVAALHGSKAFRDDLDGVRAEVAVAKAKAAAPAQCATENALVAKTPY
ncbi:acid phosphatase [Caulobacter sp. Root655]|uniref:acid phosphatase n=1 Tax=Caulobacter sp. Root655 TaxID=1736578 RepID=UPI0006F6727D|nr:phosphatase PAP2 family protein [Caulobacter sp. Root655]KRA61914.1 acid phosphatase [Caulobacter sp. Root655]